MVESLNLIIKIKIKKEHEIVDLDWLSVSIICDIKCGLWY